MKNKTYGNLKVGNSFPKLLTCSLGLYWIHQWALQRDPTCNFLNKNKNPVNLTYCDTSKELQKTILSHSLSANAPVLLSQCCMTLMPFWLVSKCDHCVFNWCKTEDSAVGEQCRHVGIIFTRTYLVLIWLSIFTYWRVCTRKQVYLVLV